MNVKVLSLFILMALSPVAVSAAHADAGYTEKLEFGAALEEALGHFWAIEQNLDENNAKLALVHATHPIAELYDAMKPTLAGANPSLDAKFNTVLEELGVKASTDVSRADADAAIAEAKEMVALARSEVIGDELSNEPGFRMELARTLLETSIAEYAEAIDGGAIVEMAEFQDGSAFVWRAGVIFDEISGDMSSSDASDFNSMFSEVEAAYDARADPSEVDETTSAILDKIAELNSVAGSEKLDFGAGLEETRGHFWAIEQNLDDNNAKLALVHATHPIAELYDSMKPVLKEKSPALDMEIHTTLEELGVKASTDVSRADADAAIADARAIVDMTESAIIGDYWAGSADVRLALMNTLLETSIAEYAEAIDGGAIVEMAEFQDGSAFVWRAGVIFEEIRDDLPTHEADEMAELFEEVNAAYDRRADPSEIETLTGGIMHEVDEILGVEVSEEDKLQGYVDNIVDLLTRADAAYASGDSDLALSLVTKAYLDNFEFLESPLVNAGERELMEDVEHEMREELRTMIKNGAPASEVSSQIDSVLVKMETVAVVVPEFGTIAMMVLVVSIVAVIALASRSKTLSLSRI
ncbi:MAG: PEFG-CTERM sorting domain-containing protein [Candidatus Nitrosopelagicus sp.]|nr:PEFG-CTERM sorting domain-containing protein [Candidatus Nitrosopelagicus sp.]